MESFVFEEEVLVRVDIGSVTLDFIEINGSRVGLEVKI